jgi:plastocyanin
MSTEQRTTHSITHLFGQALLAGTLLVILILNIALLGGGDFIEFMIGITVFAAILAIIVWRFDRQWARIVALIGTFLILMTSFWFLFGLFQPFSPLEFVSGLAFAIGLILAFFGGVAAIRARRKGKVGPTDREGRLHPVVASILVAGAVASLVGFMATKTTVSDADAEGAVVVDMIDFVFNPEATQVAAGGKLLVTNSDMFVHDFTLEEFDIAVTVGPRSETLIDVPAASPGTYDYLCTLHSDGESGMKGTITIES